MAKWPKLKKIWLGKAIPTKSTTTSAPRESDISRRPIGSVSKNLTSVLIHIGKEWITSTIRAAAISPKPTGRPSGSCGSVVIELMQLKTTLEKREFGISLRPTGKNLPISAYVFLYHPRVQLSNHRRQQDTALGRLAPPRLSQPAYTLPYWVRNPIDTFEVETIREMVLFKTQAELDIWVSD